MSFQKQMKMTQVNSELTSLQQFLVYLPYMVLICIITHKTVQDDLCNDSKGFKSVFQCDFE